MFFLLIACFSFIIFHKSLSLKPLPLWAYDMSLLSLWVCKDFPFLPIAKSTIFHLFSTFTSALSSMKRTSSCKVVVNNVNDEVFSSSDMLLLDLPELVLECILEKLPPEGLCNMASVCRSLRDRCSSDHLWTKHMKQKWGKIVGPCAYKWEWKWQIASSKNSYFFNQTKPKGLIIGYLSHLWPFSLVRSYLRNNMVMVRRFPPVDSVMSWYLALESGKFWFPAQVYNRENGHVGFMLSCYDAEVCYNPMNDTFQARYPPHGNRAIAVEDGIIWDRLRAAPIDTLPHDLHISDCLNDLCPGDHIEIQWRRSKEYPYGWWYGVVGHLEMCDGNHRFCRCHQSGTVMLEFNQYTIGSRWRRTNINRKEHREEGNEEDGFYGGIRKLHNLNQEISTWKSLWPPQNLE